jgi:FAD/FMN-containing dehydrogenase
MRAILPNGTLITATRCQNTELFFALRGGGGSTFGIVMETSILAHQEKPMEMISLTLGNEEQHVAESFIQTMVNNAERWAHEGWGGFFQPGMYKSQPIIVIMATSMLDHLQARASMKPILEFAHQFGASTSLNMTTFPTFGKFMENISKLDSMSLNNDQIPVSMSSRIIPRHNFQERSGRDKLTRALNDIMLTSESNINSSASIPAVLVCLTTPFKYSKHLPELDQKGRPGYSSVTPAWRDGLWHVVHKRTWGDDETPSGVAKIWKKTSQAMDPMRNLTPGGGAYQNEADAFEPDSVTAFWGQENYDRLLKIKREVDPENIFTGHQGVGWDRQNPRYDCYPR